MSNNPRGGLLIVSGPSGAGKSTVVRQLVAQGKVPVQVSVSATTRSPRPNEANGREYYFIEKDKFDSIRAENGFLECFEVFGRGYWYGTLRSEVERLEAKGVWVLLEIDVEGAQQVLARRPDAVTIFLSPGTMKELERRLRGRGTESEESIQSRLSRARHEMNRATNYQHIIVNDTVDQTVADIVEVLDKEQQGEG